MAKTKPLRVAAQSGLTSSGDGKLPLSRRPALAGLIDEAGDPMMLFRPDGSLLWVNPVVCAKLNQSRDDLLLSPLDKIAPDFGTEPLASQLVRTNAQSLEPIEGQFARPDGSRWTVALQARAITCDDEAAILVLVVERSGLSPSRFEDDAALRHRLAGEAALAAISSRLVQAINDDLDAPIRVSLAQLCQTVSADCGDVLLLDGRNSTWKCSHHWATTPHHRLTGAEEPVPTSQLGWVWHQLMQLFNVVVRDVDQLPSDASSDRRTLVAGGLVSAVFAPLVHGGELLGCVLLGRTRAASPWNDGDVAILRSVADLFATSIERQRMQIEMSGRLQFESLIGEIASSLLRTPSNLLDAGIEQALQRLAEYLRADRAAILLMSADGRRFSISHEVCEPSLVSARETVQDLPVGEFLSRVGRLSAADVAMLRDMRDLPESAGETRQLLDLFGIGSALAVPLVLASEVAGAIVVGRSAPGLAWDEQQVALLRACADIIITTIQRLRIEQALRESDEKFSRTFLAMPDAVAITELETGRIIEANPAFESGLGLPLPEVIGRSSLELGFWSGPEERQSLIDDVLLHGLVRNRELVIRRANGEAVDLLLSAVKIELRGKPFLCVVMRDVSAAKAAEQALRTAESALRELNLDLESRVKSRTAELETSLRELESFSYSVSHDLRSPLRGINGFATLLAEDFGDRLDESGREYLQRISSATVRMGNLIDELLDLARIARVPMRKSEIDLSGIARSILGEFRDAEPAREVELVTAESLPGLADPGLIHIALSNLLGNAWKFTGATPHPRIELGSRCVGGEQQIFVRDNGVGFDMSNSQLLFRPFSRLHRPTEYPGTGIGLATVARIIQRHGGRIWAEGQVGQGASFYFTLG